MITDKICISHTSVSYVKDCSHVVENVFPFIFVLVTIVETSDAVLFLRPTKICLKILFPKRRFAWYLRVKDAARVTHTHLLLKEASRKKTTFKLYPREQQTFDNIKPGSKSLCVRRESYIEIQPRETNLHSKNMQQVQSYVTSYSSKHQRYEEENDSRKEFLFL
ncbi:uncharacterized protein LOC109858430 [Pseudomyrmex gracilis]|uniref:uncharacterized protein LOC109858430 n=1 Tax=Pseudomyrmex gracilis TaxID=219809 RepID=UPI0009952735|nr:uncharacterized protein LOC109858430 [Pseudomyrmex gracilis]